MPASSSLGMTFDQLDPSAQAPCTRTAVNLLAMSCAPSEVGVCLSSLRADPGSLVYDDELSRLQGPDGPTDLLHHAAILMTQFLNRGRLPLRSVRSNTLAGSILRCRTRHAAQD